VETEAIDCEAFLLHLSTSKTIQEQIKEIHNFKGVISQSIKSKSYSDSVMDGIKIITILYLQPDYSLLRKAVEWIIELVCGIEIDAKPVFKKLLHDVCAGMFAAADAAGALLNGDIDVMTGWAVSFTCATMFDKEFSFLDGYNVSHLTGAPITLNNESPLLKFLSYLDKMFSKVSRIVSLQNATDSSAEVLKYSECSGECMRAIMHACKSRKAYIGESACDQWMKLIDNIITNGFTLLQSENVHKDVLTASAMCIMCLQWIARFSLGSESKVTSPAINPTPSLQLLAILRLLDLSSKDPEVSSTASDMQANGELLSFALHYGLHPDLVKNLSTLPMVSRCAILRACLAVFDDTTLQHVITHSPTDVTLTLSEFSGTETKESLLLGPLFTATVAVCNHSMPLVRLYGLQTLESWFNCFDNSILNLSNTTDSMKVFQVDLMFSKLHSISTILVSTWSHPLKQVNHMVPTVYQRLINAVHTLALEVEKFREKNDLLNTDHWKPFIIDALSQPAQHRARYQAMSMLIPCVGGHNIMILQPGIFDSLVQAVRLRDVASSSCSVVIALLRDLSQRAALPTSIVSPDIPGGQGSSPATGPITPVTGPIKASKGKSSVLAPPLGDSAEALRPLWTKAVAAVLCSNDLKTRINSADYLIPELLKIDPYSAPYLMGVIRCLYKETCTDSQGSVSLGQMLWGLVYVCMFV
jgi:hypothetical protein